jgi:hypothetical protein
MSNASLDLIPQPHASYARRVCELIVDANISLRERITEDVGLSVPYVTRLVEDPSIVCIVGERGSGKTTVLAAAAARLAAEGHVVIPPVRPEYFAAPTSLLPTTVAHLQTTVKADWLEGADLDGDMRLGLATALDRALRQANLISLESAESSSLRADEQAADRSLAASADSDFLDNWQRLTAQVRQMAKQRATGNSIPLIVIPVDDPDLAPGMLRRIMLDLRLMTSVEGVVGITCLDLDEARFVLTDAYASSYRSSSPSRLLSARVVEAQIAKAFPDDRRVSVAGLVNSQKLSFTALDLRLPSVEELCRGYSFGDKFGDDTVATLFRMPGSGTPSPYASALPSNPRDLRGLAYRLSSVPQDSPYRTGEAAMELCKTAIATGLKQSGATDPELWPNGLPFEIVAPVHGVPSCALRFDNIAVHSTGTTRQAMVGSKHDDGSLVVTLGYEGEIETRLVTRGNDAQTIQRLDTSFSYAMLLIREFSHYFGVIHANVGGPVPSRGGSERPSQYFMVLMGGEETDHRFLNAPAWEAYFDYFVLDQALSALVPVATSTHDLADQRLVIEAFVIDFCRHIVAIQSNRHTAKNPARVSQKVRELDDKEARRLLSRELKQLFRSIEQLFDLDDTRQPSYDVRLSDFRRWVEVQMVDICHPTLVRPEFIDKLLSHRDALLTQRHRLAVANTQLTDALEQRVKASLDEAWVAALIDLVNRFDPTLGSRLAASHAAALENVERARHRLLGESALSASTLSTPADEASEEFTSDFEIAMTALDELEADAKVLLRRNS